MGRQLLGRELGREKHDEVVSQKKIAVDQSKRCDLLRLKKQKKSKICLPGVLLPIQAGAPKMTLLTSTTLPPCICL